MVHVFNDNISLLWSNFMKILANVNIYQSKAFRFWRVSHFPFQIHAHLACTLHNIVFFSIGIHCRGKRFQMFLIRVCFGVFVLLFVIYVHPMILLTSLQKVERDISVIELIEYENDLKLEKSFNHWFLVSIQAPWETPGLTCNIIITGRWKKGNERRYIGLS